MAGESLSMFPSGFKAGKLYSQIPTDGVGDFDVFRPNDVATRINKLGLIETMLANVPLIDYTDGVCPVLLVQPQSTNFANYSKILRNDTSVSTGGDGSGSVTRNYTIAPDDSNDGSRFQASISDTSSLSNYAFIVATDNAGIIANKAVGIWLKSNTGSNQFVTFYSSRIDAGDNDFNVGSVSGNYFEVTPEWQRFSLIGTYSGGVGGYSLVLAVRGDYFYAGSDNIDISFWQVQAEEGIVLSSDIFTNGTSVTRLADVVNNTSIDWKPRLLNNVKKVMYIDYKAYSNDYTLLCGIGGAAVTGGNDGMGILKRNTNTITGQIAGDGQSTKYSLSSSVLDLTQPHKIAFVFDPINTTIQLFINGVKIGENTSIIVPSDYTTSWLNRFSLIGTVWNEKRTYKNVIWFEDNTITDEDLITLTTQ